MLHPCPRCTQMLPTDAAFCRRCGAAVGFQPQPIAPVSKKRVSLLTPLLIVLLITALIFAAFVGQMVPQQVQTVPAITSPMTVYVPPAPAAVESDRAVEVPQFPPVMVSPFYPNQSQGQYREVPMIHHREFGR